MNVENRIKDKLEEIEKIKKRVKVINSVVLIFVVLALLVAIFGMCCLASEPIKWYEKLDSLGSFLSGTAGTLLATASVIFLYSSLLKQQQQLIQQSVEIDLNLEELQQTREELKGQKEELEKQNNHWEAQRIEDMYFKLVADFRSIDLSIKDSNYGHLNHDEILNLKYNEITNSIESSLLNGSVESRLNLAEVNKSFSKTHNGPYLRWVQMLHVIVVYLHTHARDNQDLMYHLSNTIPDSGKKFLFIYYKLFDHKLTKMKGWYFNSLMVDKQWTIFQYFNENK